MKILILLFLLIIILAIIFSKSTLRSIILLSVFSMIAALMYYLYQAPDVAMAELAIGAAIVPLIYVISITRQKKYVVLDKTADRFLEPGRAGFMLLQKFCRYHDLDLTIIGEGEMDSSFLFSQKDIDLIVSPDGEPGSEPGGQCELMPTKKKYVFTGSQSSFLFNELALMLKRESCQFARIEYAQEEETHD